MVKARILSDLECGAHIIDGMNTPRGYKPSAWIQQISNIYFKAWVLDRLCNLPTTDLAMLLHNIRTRLLAS
jgi:hypothetical protein